MTFSYFYISAFESIATGRPLHIPTEIDAEYVKTAEEIISISYTQSEKFSSVSTCTLKVIGILKKVKEINFLKEFTTFRRYSVSNKAL